jgi:hypothetical protein
MTWFGELRRRLSALFGWLRRPGQAPAGPLPLPPSPAVQAAIPSGAPVAAASTPSAPVVSATPAVVAEPAVSPGAAGPSPVAAAVAAAPVAKPAAAVGQEPGLFDPNLAQLKARQYFARMIAATPAGMTIDFTEWQSASVERFFLAMTSPGLMRRREAPTSGQEQLSLTNAFQGFEWD